MAVAADGDDVTDALEVGFWNRPEPTFGDRSRAGQDAGRGAEDGSPGGEDVGRRAGKGMHVADAGLAGDSRDARGEFRDRGVEATLLRHDQVTVVGRDQQGRIRRQAVEELRDQTLHVGGGVQPRRRTGTRVVAGLVQVRDVTGDERGGGRPVHGREDLGGQGGAAGRAAEGTAAVGGE